LVLPLAAYICIPCLGGKKRALSLQLLSDEARCFLEPSILLPHGNRRISKSVTNHCKGQAPTHLSQACFSASGSSTREQVLQMHWSSWIVFLK
jgi:hypothetical protein